MRARLVVLVSGEGTNLQALIDACRDPGYGAQVVAVGADRAGINGLARAELAGIPTFTVQLADYPAREDWDAALIRRMRRLRAGPDRAGRLHEARRQAVPRLVRRPVPKHSPGAATVVSRSARRP